MKERKTLSPDAVNRLLPENFPLGPVVVEKRLDSTNTTLMERARKKELPLGAVLAAETQTAGKGRMGRAWISVPGRSLTFSVLIANPVPEKPGFLTAAAALSIAGAMEDLTGISPFIKWPNDVYLMEGKAAGVLAEALEVSRRPCAVVGFGINTDSSPQLPGRSQSGPGRKQAAASLFEASGRTTDRTRLLAAVLVQFQNRMDALEKGDRVSLVRELRRRSLLMGRTVRLERSKNIYEGLLVDHTDDLGIVLDTVRGAITLPGEGTEILGY